MSGATGSRGGLLFRHGAGLRAGGGQVALARVVDDHAVGVEPPPQRADGPLHARHPAARHVVLIAIVVERNDLVLQHVVQAGGVPPVLLLDIHVRGAVSNGEAVQTVVSLGPPPVEHRAVEPTIQQHLLSAGAAGLLRTARVVQPDVDALDQVSAHVDVVVLDEHHPVAQLRGLGGVVNVPQHFLPGTIGGVGLAREHELHRPLGIVDQPLDALEVAQDQIGPLVGGEAPGETDGQGVGIQQGARCLHRLLGIARALPLLGHLAPHEVHQVRLQHAVGLPQLAVVHILDAHPRFGVRQARVPVRDRCASNRAAASPTPARCGRARHW